METWVNGVKVLNNGGYDDDEIKRYIEKAKEQAGDDISEITLTPKDGKVEIRYVTVLRKFERIRRITGYLVGSVDRWNNAKRAEERERVKHLSERSM